MPLMPGSPRPEVAAVGDDGVYRSIFQQPLLEIPATAPSYSWFEFLLHPDALQRHLETLRHQQMHGTHGATSAMELVREFLDQAQLVVDEGNGRNNRYRALLRVAAQVAVQMEIPLTAMEQQLPPHFQRLLLDGIVDFAESSSEGASSATATTTATTTTSTMSPAQAQLLHQRWTLRMLMRESQNGYLTATTKSEAEEQLSGFQIALSGLAQHHLQIAQSLQQTLADDPREELTSQTQFDAFYDLAVYFFSFNAYEKAYECFSRAFELLEDHGDGLLTQLPAAQRGSLEGYLAACEAVLDTRSGPSGGGSAAASSLSDECESGGNPTATHVALLTNPRTEACLRGGIQLQHDHFLVANDLQGVFQVVVANNGERAHDSTSAADTTATVVATLNQHILQLSDVSDLPDDPCAVRNLTVFLMLHGCWDALEHWRGLVALDETRRPRIEFAANCGLLLDYAHHSSSDAAATGAPAPAPATATSATCKVDFSATRCNRFLSDVLASRRELLTLHGISASDDSDSAVESELAALLIDLPLWILDTLVCVCAGLLHRLSIRNLSDHRVGFDLTPYGDLALLVALAQENPKKQPDARSGVGGDDNVATTTNGGATESGSLAHLATAVLAKASLPEIIALHARGVLCLARRSPREPRWISARADLALCPITKLRQSSLSNPHTALRGYLSAASLATNYFSDDVSVVGIIDQSSLVRLSQCLVTIGAHVAAAVLYQCFAPDEAKYGLRMLQSAPESHDPAFFQYFWQLPFLELLVHLHSNPRHFNAKYVTLLTHLIQSPELNASNPAGVQKEVEQRILRCYFRDLCKIYLG